MDRIRNRPKMPPRIKTAADAIKADSAEIAKMKSESMKSLSDDPIMSNIIRKDLKLTKKEVADNLALLLEVQDVLPVTLRHTTIVCRNARMAFLCTEMGRGARRPLALGGAPSCALRPLGYVGAVEDRQRHVGVGQRFGV